MAEELESFISVLNECLSGNVHNRETEARDSVYNIATYFEDDLSKADIDSAFTSLFDKKAGILKFISSALKLKGFSDAIRDLFQLLRKLICNFKDRMLPRVREVWDLCKSCIVVGKMADEKESAFETLQAMLENGPWSIVLPWGDIFRYLYDSMTSSKVNSLPGKVLQKQLQMLGTLARREPDCVSKTERSVLMKIFVSELEKQVKHTSSVKYQVIAGCMNGLTEYLYTSPLRPDDPYCSRIYDCVKSVSLKHKDLRVAPREAVLLIAAHADQFAHLIVGDYRTWHDILLRWVDSAGPNHRVGVRTLDVFYKQIVVHLKENRSESGKQVFVYFLTFFKNKMFPVDTSPSPNDLKLVIKAFGMFAAPCHTYMKQEDVLFMFTTVVQRAEQTFFREQDLSDGRVQDLPDYVQSLSSIMVELDVVTKEQLTSLQYLTVILVENFPKLLPAFRTVATQSIATALFNLMQIGGTVLRDFLSNVVYQGVIRSCSHQLVVDTELQRDELQEKPITYKDFVPLWQSLLKVTILRDKGVLQEQASFIVNKDYDEVIRATQTLTTRLDLSTRPKKVQAQSTDKCEGGDVPILDPESDLEANTKKDFHVFINMVDLMREVLSTVDHKLFDKWTQPFMCHLITESSRRPLVSGFYKLLTVALELCDRNEYFKGTEGVMGQPRERRAFYTLVCSFLRELLLRLVQYKNDLEVACLQTMLAAPVALVVPLIPHAVPAFQI